MKGKNDFLVNALGECSRGNEVREIFSSSVPVEEITKAAGKLWLDLPREERDKIGNSIVYERACATLTPEEFAVYELHQSLAHLTTGLFRFVGGIEDDRPWLVLTFEFHVFTDDDGKPIRGQVYSYVEDELRRRRKLTVQDHVLMSGLYTQPSQIQHYDDEWKDIYGKDHGRPYEQVCFDVDIYTPRMAKGDVGELMKQIKKELEDRKLIEHTVNVI